MNAAVRKGSLPDEQPDLDGQFHELVEALAEFVCYGRGQCGDGFRSMEAFRSGSSRLEGVCWDAWEQRGVVL